MRDVGDVGCLRCGMFKMCDVGDVRCLGCGMFGVWDAGCLPGCGMLIYKMPTCTRLFFVLLQDFLLKSAVHYSCYLKLNNIVDQRKITDIEKQFYP